MRAVLDALMLPGSTGVVETLAEDLHAADADFAEAVTGESLHAPYGRADDSEDYHQRPFAAGYAGDRQGCRRGNR